MNETPLSPLEKEILEYMKRVSGEHLPDEIADAINRPRSAVRLSVLGLLTCHQLRKTKDWKVMLADSVKDYKALAERYERCLKLIREFGHIESCDLKCAPVYECGCYGLSQWEIAARALDLNEPEPTSFEPDAEEFERRAESLRRYEDDDDDDD